MPDNTSRPDYDYSPDSRQTNPGQYINITNMNISEDDYNRLILYALDDLESDEAAEVEQLLSQRPELNDIVRRFQNVDQLLSEVMVQTALPPGMSFEPPVTRATPAPSRTERNWNVGRRAFIMAVMVMIVSILYILLFPAVFQQNRSSSMNIMAINESSRKAVEDSVSEEALEKSPDKIAEAVSFESDKEAQALIADEPMADEPMADESIADEPIVGNIPVTAADPAVMSASKLAAPPVPAFEMVASPAQVEAHNEPLSSTLSSPPAPVHSPTRSSAHSPTLSPVMSPGMSRSGVRMESNRFRQDASPFDTTRPADSKCLDSAIEDAQKQDIEGFAADEAAFPSDDLTQSVRLNQFNQNMSSQAVTNSLMPNKKMSSQTTFNSQPNDGASRIAQPEFLGPKDAVDKDAIDKDAIDKDAVDKDAVGKDTLSEIPAPAVQMAPGNPQYQRYPEEYRGLQDFHKLKRLQGLHCPLEIHCRTASYSMIRQAIRSSRTPEPSTVQISELLNSFRTPLPEPEPEPKSKAEPKPESACPFTVSVDVGLHPWRVGMQLAKIGIQARRLPPEQLLPRNIVVLIDVNPSMVLTSRPDQTNPLTLVGQCLVSMIEQLRPQDRITIATFDGAAESAAVTEILAEYATFENRPVLVKAVTGLQTRTATSTEGASATSTEGASATSTEGASAADGVAVLGSAYQLLDRHSTPDACNGIVLFSNGLFRFQPGDENGNTTAEKWARLNGRDVSFAVIGVDGNVYTDATMRRVANCLGSRYAFIDNPDQAQQLAREVILPGFAPVSVNMISQLDVNCRTVSHWHAVDGASDWQDNDTTANTVQDNTAQETARFNRSSRGKGSLGKGSLGSGESFVALYEFILSQSPAGKNPAEHVSAESSVQAQNLFTIQINYRLPNDNDVYTFVHHAKIPSDVQLQATTESPEFRFLCAVALFGRILQRDSQCSSEDFSSVLKLIGDSAEVNNQRSEFKSMVEDLIETSVKINKKTSNSFR